MVKNLSYWHMFVRQCYVRNLNCLGFIVCSGRVVCSSVSSLKIVVPSKKSFDGAYSRGEKPLTKYGQRVHKSWWFVWVTLNHMIYKKLNKKCKTNNWLIPYLGFWLQLDQRPAVQTFMNEGYRMSITLFLWYKLADSKKQVYNISGSCL